MKNILQNRRQALLSSGILIAGISQAGRLNADDQKKDLIFRSSNPRNAEPKLEDLISSWITPVKHFYVRSHAPNPEINPDDFRLKVEGLVDRRLSLSMNDLFAMPRHTIKATLTCAGNRRAEHSQEKKVGGVQWGAAAIGNASWTGAAILDVLKRAGASDKARHIWFEGLDRIPRGDQTISFGASIPIQKVHELNGAGALLAYQMNGKPLTADHGFPLRSLVPGYIGARSVKWISRIVVSDVTSPNHYLATAYKLVNKTRPIDWAEAGPIYRFPINAAIGSHAGNTVLKAGRVTVKGYVLPAGMIDARVKTVFLSADGGKTWTQAALRGDKLDYCWQLWQAELPVSTDTTELIVRASDSQGSFMPRRARWNAKGYLQNSWFRLPVKVQ